LHSLVCAEPPHPFPDKPVIVAEIGWPSRGRTHMAAVASMSNQALFLRRFLQKTQHEHITYYVLEAFDQPWKAAHESVAGAYWGAYDLHRKVKSSSLPKSNVGRLGAICAP
jgi:exo-beta-1,3-glucanase (GH17 family)